MEENQLQNDHSTSRQPTTKEIGKRAAWILLSVILVGALTLQIYGVDKTESSRDDCRLVESALLLIEGYHPFFGAGYAMTPMWLWTASLNAGLMAGHFGDLVGSLWAGRYKKAFRIIERSRLSVYSDPIPIHNRLRWINALAGVGVVWLAYLLAVRLSDSRAAGLTAAGICAVSPMVALWGTNFHPDQYQALFAAACVYFCLGEAERKGARQWFAAAIFCGAAIATKFIAATFWIPLLLAILLGGRGNPMKATLLRMAKATAAMLVTYMVLQPYFLVDAAYFFKIIFYTVYRSYIEQVAQKENLGLLTLAPALLYGTGFGAAGLAAVGLIWGLRRRISSSLVMLSAIIFYGALLSSSNQDIIRYAFTLLPIVAAFAGVALVVVSRTAPPRLVYPVALTLLLAVLLPAHPSIQIVKARVGGDTRTLAREWIERNVPAGSRIFAGYDAPILNYDRDSVKYWRRYFGNRITLNRAKGFPFEFFRDAVLHEERHYYKRFCYLDKVDKLPTEGYDLVELIYAPNDPRLIDGFDLFWVVVSKRYFTRHRKRGLTKRLLATIRRKGRLAAVFPGKGLFGHEILIYRVALDAP